ncbi:MAG: aldose 1-epimerase family protein [Streptosporangiaceae bacterium]
MTASSEPTQSAKPRVPDTAGLPQTPLTGSQFTISAGKYQASVTELGAGLRELSYRGRPLVTGYQPDELPPAGAGQLLAPWPNRIDGGRYEFGGNSYQLDLSEATRGNAIHGLTRWANWQPSPELAAQPAQPGVADVPGDRITLGHLLHGRTGYPFCLQLAISYRLEASTGLHVTVSAWNVGSRPAPYGTGCHPYLTVGEPVVDGCELQVEASHWLPTDDRGIPSGPPQDVAGTPFDFGVPRAIGDTVLDHAFTGLRRDEAGLAWAQLAGSRVKLGLWAGPGYDWLQVFTGDALAPELRRRALAIEPMTCPANAFVSNDGLLTLAPGDSVTHTWGIAALQP